MNSETRALLEYWGFLGKGIDEALYSLEWIAWDSFEFEKASHVSRYSFPDSCAFYARSSYAPFGVTCVILLTLKLIRILIMYATLNMTLYYPG